MLETPNFDLEIFHRNEDEKQLELRRVSVCRVCVLVSDGACKIYGVDTNLNNILQWQPKQHRNGKEKESVRLTLQHTGREELEVGGSIETRNMDKLLLRSHKRLLGPSEGVPALRWPRWTNPCKNPGWVVDVEVASPFRQEREGRHQAAEDGERGQERCHEGRSRSHCKPSMMRITDFSFFLFSSSRSFRLLVPPIPPSRCSYSQIMSPWQGVLNPSFPLSDDLDLCEAGAPLNDFITLSPASPGAKNSFHQLTAKLGSTNHFSFQELQISPRSPLSLSL